MAVDQATDTARAADPAEFAPEAPAVTKPRRFVVPEFDTLQLSFDDWIRVKRKLTYGEARRLRSAGLVVSSSLGGNVTVDFAIYEAARMETWIIEWSFTDDAGKRIPVSRDTIEALDPDTAAEIIAALDGHVAGAEEAKNGQSIGS